MKKTNNKAVILRKHQNKIKKSQPKSLLLQLKKNLRQKILTKLMTRIIT